MKITLLKLALTVSLMISTQAQADQQTITAIENASMELNLSELVNLQESSNGYDRALANYRLGLNYSFVQQQEKAISALNKATTQLIDLIKINNQDNESWALLAQVYGLRIAYQPMSGIELGPKAANALTTAQTISPNNPRVLLFKGVSKYNTPAMFGGSKNQALIELSTASRPSLSVRRPIGAPRFHRPTMRTPLCAAASCRKERQCLCRLHNSTEPRLSLYQSFPPASEGSQIYRSHQGQRVSLAAPSSRHAARCTRRPTISARDKIGTALAPKAARLQE